MSLEEKTIEAVEHFLAHAAAQLGEDFPYDAIRFDLRGRAAGQLVFSRRWGHAPSFRFNQAMLRQYGDEFIAQVVPHECAHLVAFQYYGTCIRPHGEEWQHVMCTIFNADPEVHHTFDTRPARKLKEFRYRCGCEGRVHLLTSIRHNRILRGQQYYRCLTCGECLDEISACV